MDIVFLSRLQFAVTIAFHFLFVPVSLGLSLLVALAERRHRSTGLPTDRAHADFWIRLFTTTFVVGVATGITMEFSFGTNWAGYSRFVGDIFGAPLAAEGVFAFFLESTFLGVLLFGRGRVSGRFYYAATWLVFLGAHLSALWIIIANSWQQTPAGFEVVGGRAVLTDFFAAALNPSTLPRYFHTVASTWVVGGFLAAGVAAWYLLKGRHVAFARSVLPQGLAIALLASLAMPLLGHWHAVQVAKTQPSKLAAFEGRYETGPGATLMLFGWVDETAGKTHGVGIPGLLSLLVGFDRNTVVQGLNDVAPADRPPVEITFQTYHLMIALGGFFIGVALIAAGLWKTGRLERSPFVLRLLILGAPAGLLAIEAGWAAAEIGRQPWIVWGQLRTADAVSKVVPAGQVATTLLLFLVVYSLLYVAWARVFFGTIARGPVAAGTSAEHRS
ncbi:MAG: cytochrome ubiquinol oxidase subunit I [Deltaproteobacteria bacterium]|nr:cytochrome ubiquinol oxidase subunit I [Deltaproteobacteria bacterium]